MHEKSGVSVDYYLTGTKFTARVLERDLEAPEAAVLKAKAMDRLEHWVTLEWHPIIHASVKNADRWSHRNDPNGDGIEVRARRFYISRTPGGEIWEVDWDIEEVHRKASMSPGKNVQLLRNSTFPLSVPLPLTSQDSSDSRGIQETLLAYNEDVWASLQSLIEGIGKLRLVLSNLIRTKEGFAKMTHTGHNLLLQQGEETK